MSRAVGHQIRAILSESDKLGRQASAMELATLAGLAGTSTNFTKIARRAAEYGLMTVNEFKHPMLFQSAPGWRSRVDVVGISRQVRREIDVSRIRNSVWSLAA